MLASSPLRPTYITALPKLQKLITYAKAFSNIIDGT